MYFVMACVVFGEFALGFVLAFQGIVGHELNFPAPRLRCLSGHQHRRQFVTYAQVGTHIRRYVGGHLYRSSAEDRTRVPKARSAIERGCAHRPHPDGGVIFR